MNSTRVQGSVSGSHKWNASACVIGANGARIAVAIACRAAVSARINILISGGTGAGKTTIFRVITGHEGIDSGTVNIEDKLVIGYFSQDVGEMRGRSALEEVKAGAGRVSELAVKLASMEDRLQNSETLVAAHQH